MSNVAKGTVAFSTLTETDTWDGKDTGQYKLTVVLDPEYVSEMEEMEVRLSEYNGNKQYKFTSKFSVDVIDSEDQPFAGEIPAGSKVNVLYTKGNNSSQWGQKLYMSKVRVTEVGEGFEGGEGGDVPEEF